MNPPSTANRPDDDEDRNEVEIAWSEEIKRRVEKIRDGSAETVSEEEFFRRLRAAK